MRSGCAGAGEGACGVVTRLDFFTRLRGILPPLFVFFFFLVPVQRLQLGNKRGRRMIVTKLSSCLSSPPFQISRRVGTAFMHVLPQARSFTHLFPACSQIRVSTCCFAGQQLVMRETSFFSKYNNQIRGIREHNRERPGPICAAACRPGHSLAGRFTLDRRNISRTASHGTPKTRTLALSPPPRSAVRVSACSPPARFRMRTLFCLWQAIAGRRATPSAPKS
jgi:hypothetical protein